MRTTSLRAAVHETSPRPSSVAATMLLAVGWGSLAFGAVYPWAYWPLLVLCVTAGLLGFARGGVSFRGIGPLAWACGAVLGLIVLQLIPLRVGAQGLRPLSIDPPGTWRGLAFVSALMMSFLGITRGLEHRDAVWIARGILTLGAGLAVIGIVQRAEYNGRIYGFWQTYYEAVPFGPFPNRNHFAGWMVMAIPVACGYLCGRLERVVSTMGSSWRTRVIWFGSSEANRLVLIFVGVLLMALSVLLTLSRSGIVGLTVGLLFVALAVWKRRADRSRRALMTAVVLAIAASSVAWTGTDAIVDRFGEADTIDIGQRLGIWRDTLTVIRRFPVIGTGFNTYAAAMALYRPTDAPVRPFEAHNDYLQLLAEGGVLIAGATAVVLAVFVGAARRRSSARVGAMDHWLHVGAAAGLTAIAVQEFADFSLQIPGNAVLFTMLCAIVVRR